MAEEGVHVGANVASNVRPSKLSAIKANAAAGASLAGYEGYRRRYGVNENGRKAPAVSIGVFLTPIGETKDAAKVDAIAMTRCRIVSYAS